ncbi:MAG: hypothetical protein K2K13_05740 [Clostridiales bacterium]|nr:hypothetical protein [Clostridiales bacterium]
MKKYNVSIIGDSISTYFGFTDFGYPVFYTAELAKENGLESVDDMWWKRVMDGIGGQLCVNNSYSGSLVTGTGESAACSKERCARLSNESAPDIVLIYIGTNDRGWAVPVGDEDDCGINTFYGAYRTMLRQVKDNYPQAKIVCGTLLMAYREGSGESKHRDKLPFFARDINDAIKLAAEMEGCSVADIAAYNEQYESLDYCHPTKEGHKTIADLWLKAMSFAK